MSFLAPLMLLGLALVAVPIWIHLFGSKRARRIEFAAIDFLLGSERKVSRSLRLRELLLLLARAAIFLVVPLLLAKPFASCEASGPTVERGPQGAVLILDNGVSSAYRVAGQPLLGRMIEEARQVLGELGPEADVGIVFTVDDELPTELSRDHLRLRDRLSAAESVPMQSDTMAALRHGAQLLTASDHSQNTIYLFTTRAAHSFAGGEPPWAPGGGPRLRVIDVTRGEPLPNRAVSAVEVDSDLSAGPRGLRVTAEIRNHSSIPVTDAEARLSIDGEVVARLRYSLAPGDVLREPFSASLPEGSRTANLTVSIDGDGLAEDDARFVVAHLRQEVRVLLVNGDPRTVRYDDEIFYLETALSPGDRGDTGVTAQEVTAAQLTDTELSSFDVVVLANVAALSPEQVDRLESFVSGGGGLLIGLGDQVVPEDYNQAMGPLLPQELASVYDAGYGSSGAELDVKALRLDKLEAEHPVFKVFGTEARGLRDAVFGKIVLLGPSTDRSSRRVLARYQNGAAAVVESSIGRGRVLMLTSSLDRDWSSLAIQTGFLPFIDKTVRYLGKKQLRAGLGDVAAGQDALVSIEPSDERVEVESPSGHVTLFDKDRLRGRDRVRYGDTSELGFYTVSALKGGKKRVRPESAFAVNLVPELSKLDQLDAAALPKGSEDGAGVTASHQRRVELWHALGAGLLLLLLCEGLLVLRS